MTVKATQAGDPACEHQEHEALVTAAFMVPIYTGQPPRPQRWLAVCEFHKGYGGYGERPSNTALIPLSERVL